jgi:hypothetical protein
MTPLCCVSVTVAMMSRITLHLRGFRYLTDEVIMSTVVHNGLVDPRLGRSRPENSILVFARPGERRPSRSGTGTEFGGGVSYMSDMFSSTMYTEEVAAVNYPSHTQRSSGLEALVEDAAAPQKPTDSDELHELGTLGNKGPTDMPVGRAV